jgi:hypothetical protein
MTVRPYLIARTLALVLLTTILCGCSLAGFGLGALIGSSESDYRPSQMEDLPRAKYYMVYCSGGDSVRATSISLHRLAALLDPRKYDEMRRESADSLWLPAIGEPVVVTPMDGKPVECRFIGFDPKGRGITCSGIAPELDTLVVDFTKIRWIANKRGRFLSKWTAKAYFGQRIGPSLYEIIVETERGTISIPLSEVQRIHCVPAWASRNAKWIGLGVGLVADAIIIYEIIEVRESMHAIGFGGQWAWD